MVKRQQHSAYQGWMYVHSRKDHSGIFLVRSKRRSSVSIEMAVDNSGQDFSEYVCAVTAKSGIIQIEEWLKERKVEHEYIGYTSDMDNTYESHWFISDEKDRIMFTLRWGRGRLY